MSHIPYRSILALSMLFAILVFTTSGFAQSGPSGALTGSVQDPNGAHLPGVSITVRSDTTGASRSVTTDSEGRPFLVWQLVFIRSPTSWLDLRN